MYKTKRGVYEEDFRWKGYPRLHVSYGETTHTKAKPLSEVVHRLFREARGELIEQLRAGRVTVHQLAALVAENKPLEITAVQALVSPWPTLSDAADAYVTALEDSERKADGTARQARVQLDRFIAYAGADTRVNEIDEERVNAYQQRLRDEGAAQNTVVAYVWRVSGLYTWLARQEGKEARKYRREPRTLYIPIDPEKVASRQTRRDRWLTEEEANRVVAATPEKYLAAVLLGLLAGLRVNEMLRLRPNHDVDLSLGLLTIQEQPGWHPKNRKRRVVPIAPQLADVLGHHLLTYASDAWLFPSDVIDGQPFNATTVYAEFRGIVERAELVYGRKDPRGVVFHTLRHTFASWLVMKGGDLYVVSQLLGNSMAMVEQVYAHLAPDFKARAVARLHGVVAVPQFPTSTDGAESA